MYTTTTAITEGGLSVSLIVFPIEYLVNDKDINQGKHAKETGSRQKSGATDRSLIWYIIVGYHYIETFVYEELMYIQTVD